MTKHAMLGGAILAALGLMAGSAFAQGYGRGNGPYGAPAGQGGPGSLYGTGQGPGAGQGWRARVAGLADQGAAAQITGLHERIRARQWGLRFAPDGTDTAGLEQEIGALRTRLQGANRAAGLCDGTGPHAYGLNGGGFGRGAGQGYRNGAGRGQGGRWGTGQGMGRGMGFGPAW